jgi:hypothetical protein
MGCLKILNLSTRIIKVGIKSGRISSSFKRKVEEYAKIVSLYLNKDAVNTNIKEGIGRLGKGDWPTLVVLTLVFLNMIEVAMR